MKILIEETETTADRVPQPTDMEMDFFEMNPKILMENCSS